MTAERLQLAMATLHWSSNTASRIWGCSDRTVRRWLSKKLPVPDDILAWTESAAQWMHDNPAPRRPHHGDGA
jgi:hypothetical protein